MVTKSSILVTGAAGEVGSIGSTLVKMLIDGGESVRAFVRQDDSRAEHLRSVGADVFVGDLLNIAEVAAALDGCRRVYFGMGLSPYYTDATILMAAAAREQENLELFVNISEFEQSFMTFEKMTEPRANRLAWLGGRVSEWSPQQRAHWASEQALNWSGLPVVHIRANMFVENPLLSWFPVKQLFNSGELQLPFGNGSLSPIAAYDVAEACANVLRDPTSHAGKIYELTGPVAYDMDGLARAYSVALSRPIRYVAQDPDEWIETYIDPALGSRSPHTAEHLKTLIKIVGSAPYDVVTPQLEMLLNRPPHTLEWALARSPQIVQALATARA